MIKDTNDHDEVQRVRPGRVLSAGAPPLEVVCHPPGWRLSATWKLSLLTLLGIYGGALTLA